MLYLRTLLAAVLASITLPAQITHTCQFVKYGVTCGPDFHGSDKLEGTPKYHRLRIELAKAPANSSGLLAVGLQELDLALPGFKCPLLADPRRIFPIVTDKDGKMRLDFNVPDPLTVMLFMQTGFVVANEVITSNGVKLTCAD